MGDAADHRPGRSGAGAAPAATLAWLLPLLALALAIPAMWRASPLAGPTADEAEVRRALAEGNRLVREGDPEAAVEVYTAAWNDDASGDVAGVLAYNLGTTLHRLDRRPEALLWYLRSRTLRPDDRWLDDNLALVRRELAAPRQAPPGPTAAVAARREGIRLAAVVAAWAALALLIVGRRTARRARSAAGVGGWALAIASLLLWFVTTAIAPLAPRPAVLLAPCGDAAERSGSGPGQPDAAGREERAASTTAGESRSLPAGSEVWARPVGGGWAVAGPIPLECPPGTISLP